ncbi:cupin [Macrococcoides canis]|uniref:cupin domain-containing protein n=1 Tax=Macrococcoides canis TaxID=1855823 RepID=UPI00105EE848|nr:cupin domain-containing protein [Macrococcus canis]TDM43954.1 cupin [Macrococcus canis]
MKYKILHTPTSPSTPNHMILPVIIYNTEESDFETHFENNGWHNIWTNGVFDYHHFHPNQHEVLGIKSGSAKLLIGGENGQKVEVTQGDVLLLPAGYGHKKLEQSEDFKVVGAYPETTTVETSTTYEDINEVNKIINTVPLPDTDPVSGSTGPMFKEWHNIYQCSTVRGG